MILVIRSPLILLGKNKASRHPYEAGRQKRTWEELAAWSWKANRRDYPGGLDPANRPHDFRIALPMDRPTRADPHNYTSFEVAWIIDGYVKVGLLENDTASHITVHDPVLFKRRSGARDPATPVVVAIDEPLPEGDDLYDPLRNRIR